MKGVYIAIHVVTYKSAIMDTVLISAEILSFVACAACACTCVHACECVLVPVCVVCVCVCFSI